MLRSRWTLLWALWATRVLRHPTPPVRVSNGLIRGTISPDGSHLAYYGIPYATVQRFQDPQPEPKWEGVFDAIDEHIRCKQRFTKTKVLGIEDCLALNVYTSLHRTEKLLPVMVFIHGGGFRDGSGSPFTYGPEYLIKHEVILVTFNYRLEVLGFLCLGTKDAPGNAGLKDQVAALKWVKRNIAAFGGDPDNVTLFGESAGSVSVMYHLLSPMSNGLYDRVIMQSGSAMSPWSLQFEPLKIASVFAAQMGYNTTNPNELIKILKSKTADELLHTRVPRNEGDIVLSENVFVPCIEKKIPDVEQFLSDSPYNLLTSGKYNKVPVIMGYNSAEGLMFAGKENDTTIAQFDFNKAIPRDLTIPSDTKRQEIAQTLEELYMHDEEISRKRLVKIAKYQGDSSIIFPVITTIDILLQTSNKPVYVYKMCYDGWMNLAKMFYGFIREPGATHADELFYMFKLKISLPFVYLERNFISKMTSLWTNFAKYSDPTPVTTSSPPEIWRPASKTNPLVFNINKQCKMAPLWDDSVFKFWNTTYSKYRRKF